jgi:hypothetical protein
MLERDDVRDAVTEDQGEVRVQDGETLEEDEAVDSAEEEVLGEENDDRISAVTRSISDTATRVMV